jgi:LmbE family N-acetylglucosaminyl deacetylase
MTDKAIYMLAISPHPFDNDWGVAGTAARLVREGKEVVYVVCTNGDKGSSDPNIKAEELARTREREQTAAAKILGVKEVVYLNYPDLTLEYTPAFRHQILRLILKYRPEIVVTCDPDFPEKLSNPDHRVTGRAVMDAVWPYAQAPNTYPDLQAEGLQLHKVKEIWLWQTAAPNLRSDISDTFQIKMEAVKCHWSQISVLSAGWEGRTYERAVQAAKGENFKAAEPFLRVEVLQRL